MPDRTKTKPVHFFQQGKTGAALQNFNQVILREPNNESAYYGRALVYSHTGKLKLALSDLLMARDLGKEINPVLIETIQKKILETVKKNKSENRKLKYQVS